MNNYSHSVRCNTCRQAEAPAKLHTYRSGNEMITEAKYVCVRCGTYVRRETVDIKKIEK